MPEVESLNIIIHANNQPSATEKYERKVQEMAAEGWTVAGTLTMEYLNWLGRRRYRVSIQFKRVKPKEVQ